MSFTPRFNRVDFKVRIDKMGCALFAIFCCCAQEERKIRGKRSQVFDEEETIVCAWDFFDFLLCSVSKPRLSSDFFSHSISTLKKSCH